MAKGPTGNAPRDLHDSFVGENVLYKGGEPPKKARNPKKVTSNTFHSKVTGETSNKRPDRTGHFRSGGFVRGYARGGAVEEADKAEPMGKSAGVGASWSAAIEKQNAPPKYKKGGFVRGKDGADAGDMKAGFPKGPPNKKLLQDADDMESVVKGGVKKGGKA